MFKVGDYVTRNKYGNDIVFIISKIENNKVLLKGVDIRLYADTVFHDLSLCEYSKKKENYRKIRNINSKEYFYIPAKIVQLDSDKSYLDKCLDYYKEQNIKAFGFLSEERNYRDKVIKIIEKHKPDIIVLTGHDAFYKKEKNGKKYKNSDYFIEAVIEIRKKYKDIVIFAGACQSNYEELIKVGSTYASSPKHINIHALDPAIVASYISLTDKNQTIDIKELLSKTNYGSDGIGGLIIRGRMNTGFPRGGNID